jgi:pimeloyl-ACP methyl ester carboxylesterase
MARFNEGSTKLNILSVNLLNGGIFPSKHYPVLSQRLLRMPVIGTILAKWSNYYMFRVTLNRVLGPETELTPAELHDAWRLVLHNDGHRVNGEILSYIDQRFQFEARWVGALREFKKPLNLIYGPADPVNPPPYDQYFREIIPNGSIDVLSDKIGHYPQMEDPENVIAHYFAFLKRNGLN